MNRTRLKTRRFSFALLLVIGTVTTSSSKAADVRAAIILGTNKAAYLFLPDGQYARVLPGKTGFEAGYPKIISSSWPGRSYSTNDASEGYSDTIDRIAAVPQSEQENPL